MDKRKYKVSGMSCAACVARVEKSVKALSGVDECEVNLLLGSMTVLSDASDEDIISAVRSAGYDASLQGDGRKSSDEKKQDEGAPFKKIIRRLVPSCVLLFILMYISMGHMMWHLPLPEFLAENPISMGITQLWLSGLIMVINKEFFINGARGIVHLAPNMDTLVSLGSLTSFVYSLYVLYLMSADMLLSNTGSAMERLHGLYFESAAMILVLITVGKLLEALAKGKTTSAIRALMDLTPKMATVIRDDGEVLISAESIAIGDIFIVKRGENIPADGEIVEGLVSVDESALSGESVPIDKSVGDGVFGATSVLSGYAKVRAVSVGEQTAMAKIIAMVKEASGSKAPVAKAADKVAGVFVPCVMALSLLTFIVWMLVGVPLGEAVTHAVAVLVISCPCALGLATPVAVMVGSGVGAKNGILFKTAASLEASGKIKMVALDKTGTVTEGNPAVCEVISFLDNDERLIALAASLESKSEHPLARAVNTYAKERGVSLLPAEEFLAEYGGVSAAIDGSKVFGGNVKYIEKKCAGSLSDKTLSRINELSGEGKTVLIFASELDIFGIVAISDKIREDSPNAIKELEKLGIQTVMLTGDNRKCAEYVAGRVGISRVVSEVNPLDKAKIIRELSLGEGDLVAMVGDGINDSVALVEADVGISIGSATDVAIDSADVVLTRSSLSDVAAAVRLGRRTLINIYENLFWAFCYNIIGIPLAAGAFIPIFGWSLNPMFGAAAMSVSSFLVVMNALRLNLYDPTRKHNKKAKMQTNIYKKETEMEKLTIKIEGMMCPHCSGRVKSLLLENPAVSEADVSHERGDAIITLKEKTEISVLEEIITDAGYKVIK